MATSSAASVQDEDGQEVDRGSRRNQTNDNPSADLVRVYLNGICLLYTSDAADE